MQSNPAGRGRAVAAVRSEINVTPLVDVCLVLLIIFMLVTPLLRKGMAVELPQTGNPGSLAETRRQLTVSIRSDGSVFVDRSLVTEERLGAVLAALHGQGADRPVVVDGDRRLSYRTVASVLQRVREAGFGRVGLATERRKAG
ncbi:MAG: biopolymer transporter ExbD [Acidobacteriota bacterium]|nr:biopolymer transporter ExbD [Acidobacteriota bacterium]